MKKLIYDNSNSFFEDLTTYLTFFTAAMMGCFYFGFEVQLEKEIQSKNIESRNDFMKLALAGLLPEFTKKNPQMLPITSLKKFNITLPGKITNSNLILFPYNLIYSLAFNYKPSFIEFFVKPSNDNVIEAYSGRIDISNLGKRLAESMFIQVRHT